MEGIYQLADLTVKVDGTMKEIVKAQHVQREFERACRRLREASGSDKVMIRIDEDLESRDGNVFDKVRLRAYASDSPEIYTIDCGTCETNPFGIYVGWDEPIQVYNRETGETRTIGEQSEEPESAANPSGDPELSGSQQRRKQESKPDYHPAHPPEPTAGTEHGQIDEETALTLWNAAKASGGYDRDTFREMLSEAFGVENPKLLHVDDWKRAWKYACDQEAWENEEEVFEPDDELPF